MIAPDESAASQVEETAAPEIQDLRSLTDAEVGEVLTGWGHKSYRTRQLLDWIYKKRVRTFDEMTDLSQVLRVQLSEAFRMQSLECAQEQVSSGGMSAVDMRLTPKLYPGLTLPHSRSREEPAKQESKRNLTAS